MNFHSFFLIFLAASSVGLALICIYGLLYPSAQFMGRYFGKTWLESLEGERRRRTLRQYVGLIGLFLGMGAGTAHSAYLRLAGLDPLSDRALNTGIVLNSVAILWGIGWHIMSFFPRRNHTDQGPN